MPIYAITPRRRAWNSKDGTSIAQAKSWTSAASGTTYSVPSAWESGSEQYDHYWAVKLSAGTAYSLSSQGGEMSTLKLLDASGATLAEQSMDYDEWVPVPGTYTPASDMVAYIYLSAYDGDTVTFSPRPSAYETEGWSPFENAKGLEEADGFFRPFVYNGTERAGISPLNIPENGLLFYAPLDMPAATAPTGQTLSASSSGVSYATEDGIPCARFDSYSGKLEISPAFPTGKIDTGLPCTASLWVKTSAGFSGPLFCVAPGTSGDGATGLFIGAPAGACGIWSGGVYSYQASADMTSWRHVLAAADAERISVYLDGELLLVQTMWDIGNDGRLPYLAGSYGSGGTHTFLAGVRLYDRVLSPLEIKALSREFKA